MKKKAIFISTGAVTIFKMLTPCYSWCTSKIYDAFQKCLPAMDNPYFQESSSEKAYELIKAFLADKNKYKPKYFYDLQGIKNELN